MRKTILSLLALAAAWPIASAQTFSGGDGSAESPYLIKTKADLSELSTAVIGGNTFAAKHFRLESDIAFTSSDSFTPIGYTGTSMPKKFAGDFNGNSHKLSGLEITGTYYAGIFCWLDAGGSIHDLSLDNIKVTSSNSNGGTLAAKSDGTVSNVRATNIDFNSTNGGFKGGLVGFANSGTVSDCYFSGSVMATGSVGGIVGQNYATILRCHSNAVIVVQGEGSASAHIGGVASITLTLSGDTARIADSYFTGSIQAAPQNNCGGISSTLNVGYIDRCWNGGYLAASGYTGGLVGTFNAGLIRDCYNAGTVVGSGTATGGLVGVVSNSNKKQLAMSRCINMGGLMIPALVRGADCELVGQGIDQITLTDCKYDRQMSGYTDSDNGLATSALTSGTALPGFGSDWVFAAGMYPRLSTSATTEAALLNATPVLLAAGEDHLHVKSAFSVSTANDVEWEMRGGTACSLSGSKVNVSRTDKVQNLVLTAYLGDYQKRTLVTVYPQIFTGDGTAASPYIIASAADMVKFSSAVNTQQLDFTGEHLRITADLDFSGVTDFQPIGFNSTGNTYFNGTLDGADHRIKNLGIDARTNQVMNVGLFTALAPQAVVRNLVIDASCRFLAYRNFGSVAAQSHGLIENCRNYADVPTTDGYSGGILGFNYGTVRRCLNAGKVSSAAKNGGLGGIVYSGYAGSAIEECQNAGEISAMHDKAQNIGGIVGSCYGTVTDCINTGAISAGTNCSVIGGLVGNENASTKIISCLSLAPITSATYNNVGAVVGNAKGTYENAVADAQIVLFANTQQGISMLPTSALTGTSLQGFGSKWVFTAGRYPMLAAFKDLPEAQLGSMPVTFPAGVYRNEVSGTAQLCQAQGLTWAVSGNAFAISGSNLVCTAPSEYSQATLTSTLGGFSRSIPLGALPNLFTGEGTAASPWLIATPADLQKLSTATADGNLSFNGKVFALTSDLNMTGITDFAPICAAGKFQATFLGRGHVIDHLAIASTTAPAALFNAIGDNGSVADLTIGANSSITGKGSVGAFAATLEGSMTNCVNRATVASTAAILGALVGTATGNARLENLANYADIDSKQSKTGGIVGAITSATVTARNLANEGNITSTASYVGGIIAHATGVEIKGAVNRGNLSTTASDAAGILGYTTDVTLLDSCVNYGTINARTEAAGIAAYASKALTITSSLNAGDITSTYQSAAGILASGDQPVITGCANFGAISNTNASLSTTSPGAGGIVAKGDPVITDCANFGSVTAKDNAGSAIGYYKASYHTSTITNFYNTGKVSSTVDAPKAVNMFVGKLGKTTYQNCFYDSTVLPAATEDRGKDTRSLLANDFGRGLTTADNGYPMPLGIAGYDVARLHRTALLFHVAADNFGKVTDYFRVKADPEVLISGNDVFTVKEWNRVNVKANTTGDYALATSLGSLQRPVMLHVESGTTTSVDGLEASDILSVEYFTLSGLPVASPAPGTVVLRRVRHADGSLTTEKVVIR